jgi:proteic killer suppression protein
MDIGFATKKLRKTFNENRTLVAEYGRDRAARITNRMAVLANASRLADVPTVPPERCHRLTGDRKDQFAVDVGANWRLLFEPAIVPVPRLEDGAIDKAAVRSIRILGVEDYHGR